MTKRSAEHLKAIVLEKHRVASEKLDELIIALASNDRAQVQTANYELGQSLRALGDVVAKGDWPSWLSELIDRAELYEHRHGEGAGIWKAHLLTLMQRFSEAKSYIWFEEDNAEEAADLDVDAIIENARAARKLNELFEALISVLEKLADCDELDSVKACQDLNKIIIILRRAKAGSFMSQVATWTFARRFLPNLFREYVKQSKAIGPILKAYEKTAEQLDEAFNEAQNDVGKGFLQITTSGFRSKAIKEIGVQDIRSLPDLTQNLDPPKI